MATKIDHTTMPPITEDDFKRDDIPASNVEVVTDGDGISIMSEIREMDVDPTMLKCLDEPVGSEYPEIPSAGKKLTYVKTEVKTKYNIGDRVYYIGKPVREDGRYRIFDGTVVGIKLLFRRVNGKPKIVEEKYEVKSNNPNSQYNFNIFGHNLYESGQALCAALLKEEPDNVKPGYKWLVQHVRPGTTYVTYDTNVEAGPIGLRTHKVEDVYFEVFTDVNGVVRKRIKYFTPGRRFEFEYEINWTVDEWIKHNYRNYEG